MHYASNIASKNPVNHEQTCTYLSIAAGPSGALKVQARIWVGALVYLVEAKYGSLPISKKESLFYLTTSPEHIDFHTIGYCMSSIW